MLRIILVLLIVGAYLAIPITASASGQQVVIITASPYITGGCVQNFAIELVEPFGVHISWTSGNGTGTRIIAKNGGWPASTTDGFIVYDGNNTYVDFATSASSEMMQDVYFHAYTDMGNGTYSVCYASGSITGGEAVAAIGGNMLIIGLLGILVAMMGSGYIFKVPALLYLVLLGGAGAGVYLLGTETTLSLGWIVGWVYLILGFLALFSAYIVSSRAIDEHNKSVDLQIAADRQANPSRYMSEEDRYAKEFQEAHERGLKLSQHARAARTLKRLREGRQP